MPPVPHRRHGPSLSLRVSSPFSTGMSAANTVVLLVMAGATHGLPLTPVKPPPGRASGKSVPPGVSPNFPLARFAYAPD